MAKCKMGHSLKILKWHKTFINISKIIAKNSYCKKKKVGCIIVKNNQILSFGYNGTPHGFCNKCEKNNITKKEVLHAESNAILKCAKSHTSTEGAILYITLSPCFDCCKLIVQSGIKEVYFHEKYHDLSGLKLLKKSKIKYERIQ